MALDLYAKGAKVWIRHPEIVWEEAEVVERSDDRLVVKPVEEGEEEQTIAVKSKEDYPPLKNPDILIGENDLTSLSYLHEPAVLHNLEVRFVQQNSIYTYCGIVLVAINPYERLPIYGNDIIEVYKGQSISSVDPHVYAVAEQAYRQMARNFAKRREEHPKHMRDKLNQSVIISGESGAGKTVSAKFSMRYFAAVGGAEGDTRIEDKVLASNPVMESLGNAKTTRNDNSSRFGKYIELGFDKRNHIMGANMRTYLLEKTRVVFQAEEERNYHIFYQLCAMREEPELEDLSLLSCEEFTYTNGGDCPEVASIDDKEEFRAMQNALTVIGVKPDVQRVILRILGAILHMGNITYKSKSRSSDDASIPTDDAHFPLVASLLGVDKAQLLKWLCNRKISTGRETMVSPLNIANAMQARDALAKHTYSQLFNWVVNVVNTVLRSTKKQVSFIGVLDIYGFEIFKKNSFEQFCINFANEMLQQQFTQHVFKLEQEEYLAEQIKWSMIDYADNEPCIELISHQKNGIIAMLDEECKLPRGSDDNWGEKLIKAHSSCTFFRKPKVGRETFVIVHFAAPVEYTTNGFMDKNKDAMNEEHLHLLRASEFALVGELFEEKNQPEPAPSAGAGKSRTLRSGAAGAAGSTRKSVRGASGGGGGKRSVGSQFRDSLTALMETLNSTTPNYIRCIKPNDFKAAFEFDPNRAVEQLRACGVLETIRISSAGYPSRWSYRDFFARYGFLVEKKKLKSDPRASTEIITQLLINDDDKYQFGKNKVFFRAGQVAYLERLRSDKLNRAGIIIQKTMRAYADRKKYVKIRRMALFVQARLRGKLARQYCRFLRETKSATTIQTAFRAYAARKRYQKARAAIQLIQRVARGMFGRREFRRRLRDTKAVIIQSRIRGWLQRLRYTRTLRGIVLIQSCWRRLKAKQQLRQLKLEARSVGKLKELNKGMEVKVIQLQQRVDDQTRENKNLERNNTILNEELNKLRQSTSQQASSNQDSKAVIKEHEQELTRLREALQAAETELSNSKQAKERLVAAHQEEKNSLREEISKVQNEMKEAKEAAVEAQAAAVAAATMASSSSAVPRAGLSRQMSGKRADSRNESTSIPAPMETNGKSTTPGTENALNEEMVAENERLRVQLEEERQHHQSMLKEHNRLQQRYENLEEELVYMNQHGASMSTSDAESRPGSGMSTPLVHVKNGTSGSRPGSGVSTPQVPLKNPSMSSASIALADKSFSPSGHLSTGVSPNMEKRKSQATSNDSKQMLLSTTPSSHTEKPRRDFDLEFDLADQKIAALKQTNAVLQSELDKACAELDQIRMKRPSLTSASTNNSSVEYCSDTEPEIASTSPRQSDSGGFEIRLQQEVTRLTVENLELQDEVERLQSRLAARESGGDELADDQPLPVSSSVVSMKVQSRFRGLLRYEPSDEPLLVKRLIIEMKPQQMVGKLPCLPATMLFMCLRYLDDINDERRVQSLLTSAISSIRKVTKKQSKDLELRIFWLSNVTALLTYMKQYSGEKAFLPDDENLAGFCLNNFDLTDYRLVLNDLSVSLYQDAVSIFKAKIQPMISGAMLEHGIPGMWPSKPNFSRGKEQTPAYTPSDILAEFNALMGHMINHCLAKDIIDQMFKQVMSLINAFMLNNMLLRKDLCHLSRGPQIRYNLSQLEEWCYEKLSHPPVAISQLNPITQAAQLLQINKQNPSDVDAIVELCHSLNPLQIQKLLTMYTPTSEFEKRVPASVIKAVNAYFKGRSPDPGRLMMDVDKVMAVIFNHQPIDRDLRDVAVPEDLELKFVRRT